MPLVNLQTELTELIFNEELSSNFITPVEHIHIYRQNILNRMFHTLKTTYPLLEQIMGYDLFRMLAMEYIKQYPCRQSHLYNYGEYVSDFILAYAAAGQLVYLREIAEFEWASHLLSFAPDHALFDVNLLKRFSSEEFDALHFVLHPASFVKHFNYPILRIIELCKNGSHQLIDLNQGGISLLMMRSELEIKLVTLSPAEFAFLHALADNQSLSQALRKALAIDAHFDLMGKLSQWIANKTIVDCYIIS